MWLRLVVVGLRLGPKSKTTETFLSSSINECPFNVSNQSLAAFSFPLGPDSQTPKDRMAPEVGLRHFRAWSSLNRRPVALHA